MDVSLCVVVRGSVSATLCEAVHVCMACACACGHVCVYSCMQPKGKQSRKDGKHRRKEPAEKGREVETYRDRLENE